MNNKFNKKSRLILPGGRKLYTVIEQLKHKYDYSPFIKENLINLFKEAKKKGIQKAVFIAKKAPSSYEKVLLVYKTKPLCVKDLNAPDPFKKFLISTVYLLLPDEMPPKDIDIAPNTMCTPNEEYLDLKDEKETGEKISEILRRLLADKNPFKDIPVPNMPPTEDYFYLLPKAEKGKLSVVNPLKLVQNFPPDRSYNNNNWHMTVGGQMVAEPIKPSDPCYYDILCCNAPPKDSLYKQQNFIQQRKFSAFNFSDAGILLPLAFFSFSKLPSSPTSPPVIPPGGNYPKKKYTVPKYKVPLPQKPSSPSGARQKGLVKKPRPLQTPNGNKPASSGGSGLKSSGSPALSGTQAPNSGSSTNTGIPSTISSFKNNVGIKRHKRKIVSGKGTRRANTQHYKRNAWYNSRGFLNRGSFLRVKDTIPIPKVDPEDDLGLIPSSELPDDIQINAGTNRIGLGYSTEEINSFKDDPPYLLGTGNYFTQSTYAFPTDPDFGNVATDTYQDNLFFYPFDLPFSTPQDAYYDFFVKIKGYAKNHAGSVTPAVYWTPKAPLPMPLEGACSAVFNNKLYVIGGWDGLNYLDTVWEYDPGTDIWTPKSVMPTPRRDACCGMVGGKIYVFGGFNGGLLNTTEEYDIGLDAWNPRANTLAPVSNACCGVVGTSCYIIGGNVGIPSLDNWEYNTGTNVWANKAIMPNARENLFCSAVAGKIYVMGGNNGGVAVDFNEEYDPVGDAWVMKTPIPIPLEGAITDVDGGLVYVFGGTSGGLVPFSEHYDPANDPGPNAWVPEPAFITTPREDLCGNFINSKFYAVSGNTGAGLTDVNEEYDPNALPTIDDMTTQFMFDLLGRKTNEDAFVDAFGVANSQSVVIADNGDIVVFELKLDYTPVNLTTGNLTVTLTAFKADNSLTYGTLSQVFNNITEIADDLPVHVVMRVQQSGLGNAGGQVVLNPIIELESQKVDMGDLTVNVNADINLIDRLAYGYVDYLYSNANPTPLTSKGTNYSGAGILTGLVITSRPINRYYIWDYTRN